MVDEAGLSLYLLTSDERNVSNCTGGCAAAWPPLRTEGDPEAGEGVDDESLGTISRENGDSQITYNGKPLYHFVNDGGPGDTLGQGQDGVWFVVSPHGSPIQTAAIVNAFIHDTLGSMLTDSSGRSVYLFADDQSGVSSCSGGCALFWPPLLTIDEPVAGEGVSSSALGSFTRSDGSKQVTYNDRPLYNFVNDAKPGDTNGHEVGDVWFVVDPSPPLTLALEEQNDSGQSGAATLTSVVNRTLVQLDLLPGPTESELVHIHSGSCGADLGGVIHDLTNFVDGSGASTTVVEATLAALREGTFAINSHKMDEASVYTTCGNIPPIPPA